MTQPASNRWTVIYYRDKHGRHPVQDFLRSLTSNARAAVMRDFSLLEEFGLAVGFPAVRPVKGVRKLWELRAKTADGAIRIFYVAQSGRRFMMLHGFIKKTAKSPPRELDIAIKRLREVVSWEE